MPAPTHPARTARLAALLAAAAVAAASCGTGAAPEQNEADADWAAVTIEHAYGSTEITQRPERIVTVGWSDEATLLELGIVPVGMTASVYAGNEEGYLPWDVEKLEEMGEEPPELINTDDGIPAEQVANLAPDLILGVQSGMEEGEYDQLSEIAPTVPYLDQPWMTEWSEQTLTIGRAVGREEDAQAIVDATSQHITDAAEAHPEFAETTFAVGSVLPGTNDLGFYVDADARPVLMRGLGFTHAPFTEDMEVADGQFYGTMSLENADQVDADLIVMWFNSADEREQIEDNEIFQRIGAVESGGYVAYDDPAVAMAISTPNPLTIPWVLDDFTTDLAAAVEARG